MKKYIAGKGFVPVSAIPHTRPVRSMPSIKGKKRANPNYKPPKAKKASTSRKKARQA